MKDETNQTQSRTALNQLYLLGFTVRPSGEGNKSYWSKIAVA
ncbi:MAG: hypothetical protein ACRBBS_13235 [Thalassovita sp.]